jgi:hypothetical protein
VAGTRATTSTIRESASAEDRSGRALYARVGGPSASGRHVGQPPAKNNEICAQGYRTELCGNRCHWHGHETAVGPLGQVAHYALDANQVRRARKPYPPEHANKGNAASRDTDSGESSMQHASAHGPPIEDDEPDQGEVVYAGSGTQSSAALSSWRPARVFCIRAHLLLIADREVLG